MDAKKKKQERMKALEAELTEIAESDMAHEEKEEAAQEALINSAKEMYFDEIEEEQDGEVWGDPLLS